MPQKRDSSQYSKNEAKQRFEAALRGSLKVGPKPMKDMAPKRGKARRDSDPMPKGDPEALIVWGKRNIQRD